MEYLQELTASVQKKKKKKVFVVVVTFCFYRWEFFFKLIKIEEEKKKREREIVILCCSTIFQRVFSYNLYFLKVGKKRKKTLKARLKKKTKEKAGAF